MALSIARHVDGDAVTLAVAGEIDLSTVDELRVALASVTDGGESATTVALDLSGLTFLDSSGISALLIGRQRADEHSKHYTITSASKPVRQVLEITGVWAYLTEPAA